MSVKVYLTPCTTIVLYRVIFNENQSFTLELLFPEFPILPNRSSDGFLKFIFRSESGIWDFRIVWKQPDDQSESQFCFSNAKNITVLEAM